MVSKGLPTAAMLMDLIEDVLGGGWPTDRASIDAALAQMDLARGDAAPGHYGQTFRLIGDRDLAADYLICSEFRTCLVGVHALAHGSAQEVLDVYERVAADLTQHHGVPEKNYDRRRPPSEVSHWIIGPARVSLFCHADHNSSGRTIQLAIEHIDRSTFADQHHDETVPGSA